MKLICSYCKKYQGEREPLEDDRETHGVCPACYEWFMQQQDISSLSDYLNTFDVPVIIVSGQGRVVAINKDAERVVGQSSREVQGLLGGEAMECVYARLPEGCGQTLHCPACTIRNLVDKTLEDKEGREQEVQLVRDEGTIKMTAMTNYIDGVVSIQLIKFA